MMPESADVVICGAGIAGVSSAYHLAVVHGVRRVVLVDERPPLSLTSDKSTECYRNWWPGPGDGMVRLMNDSIDWLERLAHESGNVFNLNRRGYLFASADPARAQSFRAAAEEASALGAGPVRVHDANGSAPGYQPAPAEGFEGQPTGADLILDPSLIREQFPYLSPETVAVLHPRRCGWLSAQQLGKYLLERASERGARVLEGRVVGISTAGGRVASVEVSTPAGTVSVSTPVLIDAAGPMLEEVGTLLGVKVPVYSELHAKVAFNDHLGAIPREAPLLIWTDPQRLAWTQDERAMLADDEKVRWLLEEFPAGVHARPDGPRDSPVVLVLWTYDTAPVQPTFPPTFEQEFFPEIVLRGMATMIPALGAYIGRMPKPYVDGGYYTKTRENRPLIGPLPVEGTYVIGALSGFGVMASAAGAALLAAHVTGSTLPDYARWFSLDRYEDPAYLALLEGWGGTGQL